MSRWIMLVAVLLVAQHAEAVDHFVEVNGTNPSPPYLTWDTAATNIQDAIDVAAPGDTVHVGDGVYELSWQIILSNAVSLASANGSAVTVLDGRFPAATTRCVSILHTSAQLVGFTVRKGYAEDGRGGGIYMTGGRVQGCVVESNRV